MRPNASARRRLPLLSRAAAALALTAVVAACAAPENGSDDAMAGGDGAEVTRESATACWLRDGVTPAEARERPSPFAEVEIAMDGETATFCYSRPSARDREVMGGLVPFGEIWRLGANEASQLHLPFAAEVGGEPVEAGSYSVYAVPGEEEWEFFLSSSYQRWGIPVDESVRAAEVASFTLPAEATGEMVETFTATWEEHGEGMGHLVLEWENTRVEMPIHQVDMGM